MKYTDIYPEVTKREIETIRRTFARCPEILDVVITTLLDDAFQRGIELGKNLVLDDPNSYDLYSHEERD